MRIRFRNPATYYSVKNKGVDVDDAPYLGRHVDWWDHVPRPPDRVPPPPGQTSGEAGGTMQRHPLQFRAIWIRIH